MERIDAYCVTGSSPGDPVDVQVDIGSGRFVACRIHGPDTAPLIIALGGISAGRRVTGGIPGSPDGWWADLAGPGRPIDTDRFRVLGIDYPGGLGDSWQPAAGETITPLEHADALVCVLDDLGVAGPITIIGASYGGLVGLAFAGAHGDRCRHLVAIGAAHRSHPLSSALRGIQREIVSLGRAAGRDGDGVALARSLAMTTYRTAREFGDRFDGPGAAADYLEARGQTFALSCDADRYLQMSASLEYDGIEPSGITVPTTLIGVRSDRLVPPELIEELARALAGPVTLEWLESRFGHDAFLKESAVIGEILRPVLAEVSGEPRESAGWRPDVRTRTVRTGVAQDRAFGAVMPPIHLSVNYEFPRIGATPRYDYSRSGNPTREMLAGALADLEEGAGAVVTGSGLSAAALVLQTLSASDRVVAPTDCYGGTRRLLESSAALGKFRVTFADLWDANALEAALPDRAALLWIETPSNPLLRITDIELACRVARARGVRTLVDNTFLSPVLQRPLTLGADYALHSTTKFLNGHSDVVGGAVVAADRGASEELGWWANCLGVTGSPFDSYLTLRGLRSLHARVDAHTRNTAAVVGVLCAHEAVSHVWYPGLPDHRGHAVAARQQDAFGSLVTFELAGGLTAARALAGSLKHFTLAESLGGVESLVCHPATMTHASMTMEAQSAAGINAAQLRLSIGIEAERDLVGDLTRGLERLP